MNVAARVPIWARCEPAGVRSIQIGQRRMVTASLQMDVLLDFVLNVASRGSACVLIEGESGTGKDLISHFIHYSSARRTNAFVAVNCGAIPEPLVESELFGHEKGAFTDARGFKRGLFEIADKGTLFLDEISELSHAAQTKLLHVLERQRFRRVGGVQETEVDVRIVAASNRRLPQAVHEGRFRLDLFHRLSVIPVTVPALRERPEDILPLADFFVSEYSKKYESKVRPISPGAADELVRHPWPGNVRELRNVMERAILIETGNASIQRSSIRFVSEAPDPPAAVPPSEQFPRAVLSRLATCSMEPGSLSLEAAERALIEMALERSSGNQCQAARLLEITRDVLRYRIKRLGIEMPTTDPGDPVQSTRARSAWVEARTRGSSPRLVLP